MTKTCVVLNDLQPELICLKHTGIKIGANYGVKIVLPLTKTALTAQEKCLLCSDFVFNLTVID